MIELRKSADASARPERGSALLTDLDRLPEWPTLTVATHDAFSGELRQGDGFRQTLPVVGEQIDTPWTVADLEPPSRVAYEASGPAGAWLRMAQTVEPRVRAAASPSSWITSCRPRRSVGSRPPS
jgi:hypothetical protein